jgi:hypothetical protein
MITNSIKSNVKQLSERDSLSLLSSLILGRKDSDVVKR